MSETYGLRDVSTILVPLALGCIGWFATQYFVNPLVRLNDIKRTAHELLTYTARIYVPGDPRLEKTIDDLRKVSAQISAFNATVPALSRFVFNARGYNFKEAARRFVVICNILSNLRDARPLDDESISEASDTFGRTKLERHTIEKLLKLPFTSDPKLIEAIKKHMGR